MLLTSKESTQKLLLFFFSIIHSVFFQSNATISKKTKHKKRKEAHSLCLTEYLVADIERVEGVEILLETKS